MHECGYTFIGDTSYYKLTAPEMRVLHAGYAVENREKQDRQNGVKPGERSKLRQFDQKLQDNRQATIPG